MLEICPGVNLKSDGVVKTGTDTEDRNLVGKLLEKSKQEYINESGRISGQLLKDYSLIKLNLQLKIYLWKKGTIANRPGIIVNIFDKYYANVPAEIDLCDMPSL